MTTPIYAVEVGRTITRGGQPFAYVGRPVISQSSPAEINAWTRHAIACVNACSGIPTDVIAGMEQGQIDRDLCELLDRRREGGS